MKKKLLFVAALLMAVSCNSRQDTGYRLESMNVRVMCIDTCTNLYLHTYIGQTEEQSCVPVSFLAAGTIDKIYVSNGQKVSKGAPLVSIDPGQVNNMLKGAEAKLRQAEDAYSRVQQVYQAGGVSEIKMIEVKTQLAEASQLVGSLKKQVEDCVLTAPKDGLVSDIAVSVGQNVLPEMTVMKLVEMSGMNVRFTVPEQDVVNIKKGDKGEVTVQALGDRTLGCVVVERSLVPEQLSHSYEIKCSLTIPKGESLGNILPGMVCKIRMKSDAVSGFVVPANCVQTSGNGLLLWVVENGCAARRSVRSTSFGRDGVVISEGLHAGDTVIVSGYQKLCEGMEVICNEE